MLVQQLKDFKRTMLKGLTRKTPAIAMFPNHCAASRGLVVVSGRVDRDDPVDL
jgi:hypothetical protein